MSFRVAPEHPQDVVVGMVLHHEDDDVLNLGHEILPHLPRGIPPPAIGIPRVAPGCGLDQPTVDSFRMLGQASNGVAA